MKARFLWQEKVYKKQQNQRNQRSCLRFEQTISPAQLQPPICHFAFGIFPQPIFGLLLAFGVAQDKYNLSSVCPNLCLNFAVDKYM